MATPVEAYVTVRAELVATEKKISDLAAVILYVGDKLKEHAGGFSFSHSSIKLGIPVVRYQVSAHQWMTAEEIQMLLRDYHQLGEMLLDAWQHVPAGLRGGLQPPSKSHSKTGGLGSHHLDWDTID